MPVDPEKLYRSTYAIRLELKDGVERAARLSGATKFNGTGSVSDMLARIAASPEECGEALKPIFEKQDRERGVTKGVTKGAAARALQEADLSPAEMARLIQLAKGRNDAPDNPSTS